MVWTVQACIKMEDFQDEGSEYDIVCCLFSTNIGW